jgi:hypothetical protein
MKRSVTGILSGLFEAPAGLTVSPPKMPSRRSPLRCYRVVVRSRSRNSVAQLGTTTSG